jgi:putative ABC transport system permease protein
MKTPLAWLQLVRERVRLVIAIAGIGFADILMFMQLGFRDALFESATLIHQKLDGDLVLINTQSEAIHLLKPFSRRRLYQVLGVQGVESISSVYLTGGSWKNHYSKNNRAIMIIGFNPNQPIFSFPEVNQQIDKIKLTNQVIFDTASRPEFGPIESDFLQGRTVQTELNNYKVQVNGLFTLGTSFAIDGTVITTDSNLLRFFPDRSQGNIEIGLIKIKNTSDPQLLKTKIQSLLGKDIKVLTHEEFVAFEKNYWANGTPIGFIFTLGTIMGFVVGTIIVYQILYADVADHLPEYATLKAMGYGDRYLLILVFQEALILAIVGYLPGLGISFGLYGLTKAATKLPLMMELSRAIIVLILTIIMCFCSGAIAVRKLQDADPADIF